MCPIQLLDSNHLVVATSEGHVCLFDSNQNYISSLALGLERNSKTREKISCLAVSQDGRNIVVVTQTSNNYATKKSQLFWLQIDMKSSLNLVSKIRISESEDSILLDQINSAKFSPSSTQSDLILYMVGERDFMSTLNLNLKHREIREFKVWRCSLNRGRSYKIESLASTGAMWACDNNGNIVRFNLKPQEI